MEGSKHGDEGQGNGRGAEGSHDGGGVGNRVLMDTNKARYRTLALHFVCCLGVCPAVAPVAL